MAQTIEQRVLLHAGTYREPLSLQGLMDEAVRLVMGELPEEVLQVLATEETDDGTTGVDITNKRILRAHKAGYEAVRLNSYIRARLTTEDNYYESTDYKPAYYTLGDTAYVVPSGGTIVTVAHPTVTVNLTTVTGVPSLLLDLFIAKCSQLVLDRQMIEEREAVTTAVTLPTVPSAPSAPAIVYSDASATAPGAVSIAALPTAPVYSAPTLAAKPSVPTVAALNLELNVAGGSLTVPSAPSAPVIAYSDAAAATVSATSIGALPAPPTYSAPSFGGSLSIPSLPSLDLSTEDDGATAIAPPSAPSAPSISFSDAALGTFTAAAVIAALPSLGAMTEASFGGDIGSITTAIPSILDLTTKMDNSTSVVPPTAPSAPSLSSAGLSATTITALGTAPAYTKDGTNLSFTEYDTYETYEDPEMMAGILNKLAMELKEIDSDREDEWKEFQKEAEAYRADVQHKIEQARITVQEQTATLSQADQMALQDYVQELARYDRALAEYNADIGVQVQQFNLALQRSVGGLADAQRLFVQEYQTSATQKAQAFQGIVQDHIKECDRVLSQAQLDQQRLADMFRAETDMNVQNEIQTMQGLIADYQGELARYETQLKTYGAEIERQVQSWTLNFKKAIEPWSQEQAFHLQEYGTAVAAERDNFGGQIQDHMREADRIIQQAQITAQEAATQAQLTTNVALQNELQTVSAVAQDYQMTLELHRLAIDLYGQEIQAVVQEYIQKLDRELQLFQMEAGADVARFQAEVQDAGAAFQQTLAVYQATVERNNLAAQIARQEAQQTAEQATQISIVNEAKTMEALLADYQAVLGKYQADLSSYGQQTEAAIAKARTDNDERERKLKMMGFERSRIQETYMMLKSSYMRFYWPSRSYTVQQPII